MTTVTKPSLDAQISMQSVSDAVTARVLEDVTALRAGDGADLSRLLQDAVHEGVHRAFHALAESYADKALGAARSERVGDRAGYRSGTRNVRLGSLLGPLDVRLLKSRTGLLRPDFLQDAPRFAAGVKQLVVRLWSHGLSLRGISDIAPEALKTEVGRSSAGAWVKEAEQEVLAWLNRPIPGDIRFLMLDGMFVSKKRVTTRQEPALVAVGITDDGTRHVLDVLPAAGETFEAWSTSIHRLKGRGLDATKLRMVISDGCAGLIKALETELPNVPRQRCTVHKTRHVLHAAAPAVKSAACRQATGIWNAPNKSEARQRAAEFDATWRPEHPRLADIISDDFEATLTFYDMDANTWVSLRSTNVIERLNRELRRRFDDMGACRGDEPVTGTAGLVAMRLAKSWDGKVVRGFKRVTRKKTLS